MYAASVRQHHKLTSGTDAVAFLAKCCSQPVSDLDRWGHRSGEMKAGICHSRRQIVLRAQCAGTLSCWKTKSHQRSLM